MAHIQSANISINVRCKPVVSWQGLELVTCGCFDTHSHQVYVIPESVYIRLSTLANPQIHASDGSLVVTLAVVRPGGSSTYRCRVVPLRTLTTHPVQVTCRECQRPPAAQTLHMSQRARPLPTSCTYVACSALNLSAVKSGMGGTIEGVCGQTDTGCLNVCNGVPCSWCRCVDIERNMCVYPGSFAAC